MESQVNFQKTHIILPSIPSVCCRTALQKKYEIVVIFKKQTKNHVTFDKKTEMSIVIWLNIVTIVARSVRLLPAYMRKDVHATCQLHCQ